MVFNIPKELKKSSGIYKIVNLINGKLYIGSTKCFWDRYKGHFNSLKRNAHHTILLQRSFNKRGKEAFSFEIVELVEDFSLLKNKEQYYLNLLEAHNPTKGYNTSHYTDSPSRGKKYTERQILDQWSQCKKIIAYDMQGNFVGEFGSVSSAKRILKVKGIVSNLRKGIKKAGNYQFFYHYDNYPLTIEPYKHPAEGRDRGSEVGKKIRDNRLKNSNGVWFTPEAKQKLIDSNRLKKTGVKLSEEHKVKISKGHKGKIWTKEHRLNNDRARQKPIVVYDWLGYPVFSFDSCKQAAAHFKSSPSDISVACNGEKAFKKLYFKYV